MSTLSKKRYNHWSEQEEQRLLELIALKKKQVCEFKDNDWSEIASKLSLGAGQAFWKAKRLLKSDKKVVQDKSDTSNVKVSRREMIARALTELAG